VLVAKPDSTPDIDFNMGGPTAQSLSEANRTRPAGLSSAERTRPAGLNNAEQSQPAEAEKHTSAAEEPEINLDLLPKTSPSPAPQKQRQTAPAPLPEPAEEKEEKPAAGVIPFLVDLGMLGVLVVVGFFLGSFLVNKPLGEILAAPKFPSVEVLLLIAPAIVFALVYLLLNKRERTVGAWIRRRRQRHET
jgi:hypothetical protein